MQKSNAFLEHIVEHIDRIDKAALKNYVKDLVEDIGCHQQILDELEEGVLLVTRSGTIELANRSATDYLGLPKKGAKAVAVADIEDKQVASFLGRQVSVIRERTVQDFNILSPREQFIRAILTPIDHSSNSYVIIVLINQHREMESQMDAARITRIESLIKLAAGVAHEIGNPLNSLSIHAQLLKKEAEKMPRASRRQFESSLSVISAETDRLDRIVRNFLKATRKPPLRFHLESITAVMEEAIDFLTPELRKKHIDVTYRGDEKIPFFLMDRDRIYQIFINLLKNAMESMASRGGKLVIRIEQREKVVSISIKDEGEGISEKDLPHIFDAYYTTKEEGSGLGLMMVYDAVHEHGGRIEVKSKIGKGAVFTVLLPMRLPKLQLPEYKIDNKK